MNLDETICPCLGITNGMIKEAVDNGAKTVEEVQQATNVGTVCGVCMDDVQKAVDYFTK